MNSNELGQSLLAHTFHVATIPGDAMVQATQCTKLILSNSQQ